MLIMGSVGVTIVNVFVVFLFARFLWESLILLMVSS